MTLAVEPESIVFVVEMNNDTNRILGIGMIRNKPQLDKYYNVYEEGNFNRYVYQSEYHLTRDQVQRSNPSLVEALETILFKGKTHSKRGAGFSLIPMKLIKREEYKSLDMTMEIRKIFIAVFSNRN
jgi:hypothetical protein